VVVRAIIAGSKLRERREGKRHAENEVSAAPRQARDDANLRERDGPAAGV
jgi:hypothetical protein